MRVWPTAALYTFTTFSLGLDLILCCFARCELYYLGLCEYTLYDVPKMTKSPNDPYLGIYLVR